MTAKAGHRRSDDRVNHLVDRFQELDCGERLADEMLAALETIP